ncbi:MAG: PilN domain-containing protein [Burkholderiales bacterium]
MSQQINLLDPAFVKRRSPLSAATAVACTAAVLAALVAFQFYALLQVGRLEAELQSAQTELKAKQSRVQKLVEASVAPRRDAALDAEIARLEAELRRGRENMEALKSGALGDQQGFSEYMRAFSRQALSGLWLTGFTIAGGNISIQGRVTHADLVASYIQRLNQEKVFQGRTFAALEMHTPKGEDKDDKKKTPRFLEFTLTTAEPAASAAGGGGAR